MEQNKTEEQKWEDTLQSAEGQALLEDLVTQALKDAEEGNATPLA